MGRSPCCSKVGLRRGPWSTKEDTVLADYIQLHGEGQWRALPKNAGLLRCGKSCRLRWMNYLRPGIKRGNISEDEEDLIVRLHKLLGNRWSLIAGRLPGRTDNEIKNHWNTHLLKKQMPNKTTTTPQKPKISKKKKKISKTEKENQVPIDDNDEQKQKQQQQQQQIVKNVVYSPKPIRLSSSISSSSASASAISRTSSYDSFSSSDAPLYVPFPPLFEQEDALNGADDDVNMWEKVYHEYFQLL